LGALSADFSEDGGMRFEGDQGLPTVGQFVDPAIDHGEAAGRLLDDSNHGPLHPALFRLSGVLGREAAAFAHRYRYARLGRIQLILQSWDST
jgi:hypothetical protein